VTDGDAVACFIKAKTFDVGMGGNSLGFCGGSDFFYLHFEKCSWVRGIFWK